jgi:hypothetical protein
MAAVHPLHLDTFRNLKRNFEFDSEIADSAVHLGMAKQELHGPQVPGLFVNLRGLGSAHRVRAVSAWLKADRRHPAPQDAGILPGRKVRAAVKPARPVNGGVKSGHWAAKASMGRIETRDQPLQGLACRAQTVAFIPITLSAPRKRDVFRPSSEHYPSRFGTFEE